jgi:dolichyl-phosphate-mannose--protein O-mannosyl transferase
MVIQEAATEAPPRRRRISAPDLGVVVAWLWAGFIAVVAFAVYVHRYEYPPALFWDENYHIASAQKYLNGVFFMEPHPPLGKLLIALGEHLVHANPTNDQFIGTDYIRDPPPDFSLAGYRLIPAVLGWLTAPVLYACFLLVTQRPTWAGFLSFLYVFDNALIVHSRGAMLDSTLLFFSALTILAFLLAYKWRNWPGGLRMAGVLFGLAFACVILTKAFGLVLVLLIPVLLVSVWPHGRAWLNFCLYAAPPFLLTYILVWQVHFALGTRVVPSLPNDGFYEASPEYREVLAQSRNVSPASFPIMLRDSIRFSFIYTQGVPRLDLSKPDENGSPFFLWPLGARSINYRWETPDGQNYRYLYLQVNPVAWFVALLGVVLAASFVLHTLTVDPTEHRESRFLLLTFFGLYVAYMVAISRFDRVLYLYHYFLPLLISFFLVALVVKEARTIGPWHLSEARKSVGLFIVAGLVVLAFRVYGPLTYYEPLRDEAVRARAVFPLWELHCVRCPRESILVVYKTE